MSKDGYLWCDDQLRKPCDGVNNLRTRVAEVEGMLEQAREALLPRRVNGLWLDDAHRLERVAEVLAP